MAKRTCRERGERNGRKNMQGKGREKWQKEHAGKGEREMAERTCRERGERNGRKNMQGKGRERTEGQDRATII